MPSQIGMCCVKEGDTERQMDCVSMECTEWMGVFVKNRKGNPCGQSAKNGILYKDQRT